MKKIFLISCLVGFAGIARGQVNKDSILLNENTLTRPITLHGGQLRLNGAYGFSINSLRYDNDGEVIHLNDEGLTNIRHTLFFELKYGIIDYIGLTLNLAHKSQGERSQMGLIFAPPDPSIETSQLTETTGFTDLYLGVDMRLPIKTRLFDLGTSIGINLPTAKYKPDKPAHEYNYDPGSITLFYHFNNHWGNGVPVADVAGQFKIRSQKWAFFCSGYYRQALKEGESETWKYSLENNVIIYSSEPYHYMLNSETGYVFSVEYQPIPWMNVFGMFQGYQSSNGWSEETAQKVAERDKSFSSIIPGFEIVVTSKFWLRQQMVIPLGGKNDYGPFGITTSVSYNIFPFNRR